MQTLPKLNNSVLARTICNIEQAQGHVRHRTTGTDILQAPAGNNGEPTSLFSTGMTGHASAVDAGNTAASIAPVQAKVNTPINLTSDLAASTALLQSLRTRNSILVADLARATHSLDHHEAKAAKLLSSVRSSKARWMVAAVFLFTVWAVYLWWCWFMRVEFEYIRKRQGEVFGV